MPTQLRANPVVDRAPLVCERLPESRRERAPGPRGLLIRRRTSLSFLPPRRSTGVGFREPAGQSEVEGLRRVLHVRSCRLRELSWGSSACYFCTRSNLTSFSFGLPRASMSFSLEEIQADLEGMPGSAFNGASTEQREAWIQFVLSLESEPKAKHDLRWYTAVARMMSEIVSSVHPGDFADEVIRDTLKSSITVNDTPFTGEGNHLSWQAVKVTPAMLVYALRVHDKCCKDTKPSQEAAGSAASSAAEGFTKAMNEFVKCQGEAKTPGAPSALRTSASRSFPRTLFPTKISSSNGKLPARWQQTTGALSWGARMEMISSSSTGPPGPGAPSSRRCPPRAPGKTG